MKSKQKTPEIVNSMEDVNIEDSSSVAPPSVKSHSEDIDKGLHVTDKYDLKSVGTSPSRYSLADAKHRKTETRANSRKSTTNIQVKIHVDSVKNKIISL